VAGSLNKSSCLAPALRVTKFIIVTDMILVTHCRDTYVALKCSTNPPLASISGTSHPWHNWHNKLVCLIYWKDYSRLEILACVEDASLILYSINHAFFFTFPVAGFKPLILQL
jgi:hypothetical protein